jgi:hypothetical protein
MTDDNLIFDPIEKDFLLPQKIGEIQSTERIQDK